MYSTENPQFSNPRSNPPIPAKKELTLKFASAMEVPTMLLSFLSTKLIRTQQITNHADTRISAKAQTLKAGFLHCGILQIFGNANRYGNRIAICKI